MVRGFYIDGNGTLWAATEGGLSRIKDGRVLTLTSQNGLPCNTVHWMMEDDAHSVWLYLACGLVRIARSELDAWASHPKQTIQATVFDSSDGVSNHRFTGGYSAVVAKSADGKLWFLRFGGVSVIDPHHLAFNKLPPPVHIEQITADDKTYDATNGLAPAGAVRDLAIDYTALSLVAPEKVHFRYKLEGQDSDWKEVVNDARCSTRTSVRASTASASSPATTAACGTKRARRSSSRSRRRTTRRAGSRRSMCRRRLRAALGGVPAARSVRSRGSSTARWTGASTSGRASRGSCTIRCCRAFQGLLLQFQTASYLLPDRPDEAQEQLDGAIEQAAKAITEGRDAVQGLRASATTLNDLANGIAAMIGAELTSDPPGLSAPTVDVEIEGASRDLNPVVREEAYRIAGEALRNAFKHAQARRIIVTIHYEARQFRLVIRDDGQGIDEETIRRQQVSGHFGLPGMRERAAIVGGRLEVRSTLGSGTEIELCIPGAIAYGRSTRPWWLRAFRRTTPHA